MGLRVTWHRELLPYILAAPGISPQLVHSCPGVESGLKSAQNYGVRVLLEYCVLLERAMWIACTQARKEGDGSGLFAVLVIRLIAGSQNRQSSLKAS